jgi:hypothetical protein
MDSIPTWSLKMAERGETVCNLRLAAYRERVKDLVKRAELQILQPA